ncbi:hypothetical protein LEP1GSC047_3077 [Leptospira inadai serovar Lyme str. 10]|uniref:Uncharacterized protein n=2 Tax=Leptospira inadai serovar Lyme TaxID=293084 RepID=V6HCA1_9LEPT|nr:hypothetical protein [Leptospira inadai]EQA36438.1 hypothetical protein LEP1GSC047_3077 [Leptospira inadai serovar Lyme str. 10]PNV74654.1 hypothetical protein BES34_012680 [Leptospira inadai serovar Lyme]
MDSKERMELIRVGNQAFNEGDIRKARECFLKTEYKDGLIRLGDYFMFEKKLPILAYGYYKKAGFQKRIDEIFQRMLWALSEWIGPDKFKPSQSAAKTPDPEDFTVHPILRQTALDILKKQGISL